MPTTPPTHGPASGEHPDEEPRARGLTRLTRAQRELIAFGAAFGAGLLVMPFLIWLAGSRVLGPYVHGDNPRAGPWSLFADYVVGLAHGSAVFWAVALGPAALLLLVRGFLMLWRALPRTAGG
ncbi:MAG: hypothetical protein ACLPQ6_13855 [Steroidobacteraceae bacterium]|jgi:hypothetical protein